MKTVIIGGVAGGMSAATRLRRLDESAEIVVLERSGHVSFANCGLPYYIGDVITDRNALLLQTPSSLKARFGIDVRVDSEVISIDRAAKSVTVRSLATGEQYFEDYDALVLAPGAAPFVPPIPGASRALTLRNIGDTDKMAAAVDAAASGPEPTAVIMGGGFNGVELAENLTERGLKVTIVELADQLLAPLDVELAALVEKHLARHGVRVLTGASVTEVGADSVVLSTGDTLPASLVVAAIGVRPETGLAEAAGLELGARGGILVDEHQLSVRPGRLSGTRRRDAFGGAMPRRFALRRQPA